MRLCAMQHTPPARLMGVTSTRSSVGTAGAYLADTHPRNAAKPRWYAGAAPHSQRTVQTRTWVRLHEIVSPAMHPPPVRNPRPCSFCCWRSSCSVIHRIQYCDTCTVHQPLRHYMYVQLCMRAWLLLDLVHVRSACRRQSVGKLPPAGRARGRGRQLRWRWTTHCRPPSCAPSATT